MDEFMPQEPGPEEMLPQPPKEQPPSGLPHLDTSGTSNPADPYSMVAPGGLEPEQDMPDDVVQAYQEDLVARAMAFMSDNRASEGSTTTPADAVLSRLNVRGENAPQSIGGTAAEIVYLITSNAKNQGVEYPSPSIMGGGAEIVQLLMDLARDGGVFPDIPQEEDEEAYDQVAQAALLEAAKAYGERMVATGQADQQEYAEMLEEMMEEEAALGELDDWDPNEMMNAEALQNLMNRGVGLAQQKAKPPEGEQPPPQQGA